jgi:hypothetical protein
MRFGVPAFSASRFLSLLLIFPAKLKQFLTARPAVTESDLADERYCECCESRFYSRVGQV